MKILPIINADFDNRTGFKSCSVRDAKVALQTLPEAKKAAKVEALLVLAYVGAGSTKKAAESETDDFRIEELSDKEYINNKIIIANRKKDFKAFNDLDIRDINKWNIQLLNYMMQNPEDYNDERYIKLVSNLTKDKCVSDKNKAEVALRMLKMPWFLKAHGYARDFGVKTIVGKTIDDKVKDVKLAMLDKLDEYKNTCAFSEPQEVAVVQILSDINKQDGLNVAFKLFENPEILDDQNTSGQGFSQDCFKVYSNRKDLADMKLKLIEAINSRPELFDTPYFKHSTTGILNNVISLEKLYFVLQVLDNPELFKSQSFADNLGDMIYNFPSDRRKCDVEKRKVIYSILSAIKENPKLFKNKKFLNDLGQLVYIQKDPYGDTILLDERPIEIGKKNLQLIRTGYYSNAKKHKNVKN